MSAASGPSRTRGLAEQAARAAGRHAARRLARGALAKVGVVLSAKLAALALALVAALLLLVFVLALLVGAIGAAFQASTVPWPVRADVGQDGSYQAGGWAISSRFGWRASPISGQAEFHDGIDIVSPSGACPFGRRCALPSMLDGVVRYVGWDQAGSADPAADGGGELVIVENGAADHTVLYAHLEPYRLTVQLQGRIADAYGRYADEQAYQAIGQGELTPDLSDGGIEIWCAADMPSLRPRRTGPGTVEFAYDRPAQCRTSVVWGRRGGGWEGWIADDPPADQDGRATLSWQTPIESGRRAGDVALRFRAHLVPPPPPTATPTPVAPAPDLPARAAAYDQAASAGDGARCMHQGGGVRCRWLLSDIPTLASATSASPQAGSAVAVGGTRWRGATARQALAATPTASPGPALRLVSALSQQSVPTGGRFRVATSVWTTAADAVPVVLLIRSGGALRALGASASSGACTTSGASARCTVSPQRGSPASIEVVFEVLPGNQARAQLAITVAADGGALHATDQVTIEVAGYAVTPGPWPPATEPPTPEVTATSEPAATPAAVTPPIADGPGSAPAACAQQTLVQLAGVEAPSGRTDSMRLIAPAAAQYQAARQAIAANSGRDVLARLADALRAPEFRTTKPGVARMSFHMAGRAIDLDTAVPWRRVREGSVWRLFLGLTDVTAIMEQHGFTRIPDRADSPEWWHYEYRPDRATWAGAMLEIYPIERLRRAFPDLAWDALGCGGSDAGAPPPPATGLDVCVVGQPAFDTAVAELSGCGPPVRAGDQVQMLDSTLGFIGVTGQTTGAHLHLGLEVRGFDGAYHQTNICTPDWLQGLAPPEGASCWTELADPLAFLPLAPPPDLASQGAPIAAGIPPTAIIPEGAPYQLPPPDYPGSLYREPEAGAAPSGQYWSPFPAGGQYGGGDALRWLRTTTCQAWAELPWCQADRR